MEKDISWLTEQPEHLQFFTDAEFSVLHSHGSWAPQNSYITQHHQMSLSPDHQDKCNDNERS